MKTRSISILATVVALVAGLAACSPQPEKSAQVPEELPAEESLGHEVIAAPDTTGASLWTFLQKSNFQDTWTTWPGKGKFYEGTRPHGALLTTYLNPLALGAVNTRVGAMPDGATIVKENYKPDSTLASITVMRKFAGYNPDYNDWFFSKFLPDGDVAKSPEGKALEGRIPSCESCHSKQKDNDYLYTGVIH
ncbi:MAG: cytochrome P460 family protein [Rhodothermales bacterium]